MVDLFLPTSSLLFSTPFLCVLIRPLFVSASSFGTNLIAKFVTIIPNLARTSSLISFYFDLRLQRPPNIIFMNPSITLSNLQILFISYPVFNSSNRSCTGREHYGYQVTDHNNNNNNNTATSFTSAHNKYGQHVPVRYELDSSDDDDDDDGISILDCRRGGRSGSSSSISTGSSSTTTTGAGSRSGWLEYLSASRWHLPPPVRKTLSLM